VLCEVLILKDYDLTSTAIGLTKEQWDEIYLVLENRQPWTPHDIHHLNRYGKYM